MGQIFGGLIATTPRDGAGCAFMLGRPGHAVPHTTRIKPKQKSKRSRASSFSSLGPLHAKDHVVSLAGAAFRASASWPWSASSWVPGGGGPPPHPKIFFSFFQYGYLCGTRMRIRPRDIGLSPSEIFFSPAGGGLRSCTPGKERALVA